MLFISFDKHTVLLMLIFIGNPAWSISEATSNFVGRACRTRVLFFPRRCTQHQSGKEIEWQ